MSLFIGTLTSFSSLAIIITDPLAATLCESSLGWRSAYYFHAGAGLVLFTLWLFFYRDSPQLHPSVSEKELASIHRNKTRAHIEPDGFVPYKVRPWSLPCHLLCSELVRRTSDASAKQRKAAGEIDNRSKVFNLKK
ncbi:unnamed protein product [Heligmosomoides polygyrus]|uniref:MFS domain-containing protein n=1 Tax=Heligmosomoides polygyrus TaxID=6339 RepID=A0A183GH93_HELPZ|nr:unnamed protein product [Heligmosomoides polygyrus]